MCIDLAETLRRQFIILHEEINNTRLELERGIQHSTTENEMILNLTSMLLR